MGNQGATTLTVRKQTKEKRVSMIKKYIIGAVAAVAALALATPVAFAQSQATCKEGDGWYKSDVEANLDDEGNEVYYFEVPGKFQISWETEGQVCIDLAPCVQLELCLKSGTSKKDAGLAYHTFGAPDGNGYGDPDGLENHCFRTPGGKALSHFSFKLTDVPCLDQGDCWKGETAWSQGPQYINAAQWAMYTDYTAGKQVDLIAGQNYKVGLVYFGDCVDGNVDITITLNDGARFAAVKENVKIQDYASAPSGNPKVGQFDHKATVDQGQNQVTLSVPCNNVYGVHVDVEKDICP
jgi:hypothetical protein